MLWSTHAETIRFHDDDGSERDLSVIWKRLNPQAEDTNGLGIDGYHQEATAIVRMEDLPDPHSQGVFIRAGEAWHIRQVELQDAWTWRIFLAQEDADLRLPESMRG